MNRHNIQTGRRGEKLAAVWLEARGYNIIYRNYRQGRYELDIVAIKDYALHVVEVKTRTNNIYGFPESGISKKKKQHLISAATELVHKFDAREIQIDVLSIVITGKTVEYFLMENIE